MLLCYASIWNPFWANLATDIFSYLNNRYWVRNDSNRLGAGMFKQIHKIAFFWLAINFFLILRQIVQESIYRLYSIWMQHNLFIMFYLNLRDSCTLKCRIYYIAHIIWPIFDDSRNAWKISHFSILYTEVQYTMTVERFHIMIHKIVNIV